MTLQDLPLDISLFPTREEVYVVGGTTRDLLLGKRPVDYDIAVRQNPEIFAKNTTAACRGRLVPMGRGDKKSYRVVSGDLILDITGINGPTIREDLERRDVTINAMAIELTSGACLDWVGGRRDLAEKRIRMVSEKGFRDDPIRLLRAFRLAATLGFSIEAQTLSSIAREAPLIRHTAGERIRSELHQLLSCRDSSPHMETMARTGLLRAILREHPKTSAADETAPKKTGLQTDIPPAYKHLEAYINHPPPGFPTYGAEGESPSLLHQAAWLKLAIILIRQNRKPGDRALPENHQKRTADMAETTCRRLRLSTKEKKLVTGMISNHALLPPLRDAYAQGRLKMVDAIRFFMAVETLGPLLLLHALAEARSSHADLKVFSNFIRHMLSTYNKTYLPGKTRSPFVSGRDLKEVFGLPPSPILSRILTRLREGQISGELPDRASALQTAQKMIREFKS